MRKFNKILRSEVVSYWYYNMKDSCKYFIDIGEPNCWACEKPISIRFDNKNPHASIDRCSKIWDKVGHLQVCHIIPRSLDGSDEYSNLFLMCKHCHEESPDTIYPDIFFKWVESRHYFIVNQEEMTKAFKSYGIDSQNIDHKILQELLTSETFNSYIQNKSGLHRSIFGGARIKYSTLVGLLIKYTELNNIKLTMPEDND